MTEDQTYKYKPETISAPGETLKRVLDSLGLSQSELARRTGKSEKHISEIVNGKAPITPDMAVALERVLDVPASFWGERQRRFEESKAKQDDRESLEERLTWLDNFPIEEMCALELLTKVEDDVEQLRQLLDFFGVNGPAQWRDEWSHLAVAFRQQQAFEASKYHTAVWLRAGEKRSRQMSCSGYERAKFRDALEEVRSATTKPLSEFCQIAREKFCEAGVALVFIEDMPESRVYGATRWLSPNRALIQLSFRYKRDDIFIFTLFHEAAHVLKHRKKDIFLETEDENTDQYENEADRFASNSLIPSEQLQEFVRSHDLNYLSHEEIEQFARHLGIAPGIVVGRLRHEGLVPNSHFGRLIRRIDDEVLELGELRS